jgi:acetolactate synthase small subunit
VRTGGKVLDPTADSFVVELLGNESEVSGFISELAAHAELLEVVRSGALGVSRSARSLRVIEPA